ncbi:polysaccharide pyruvyl transferase family protein [Grimontia sp. S25]|uniref:Polysaccharide pyruvyl transferase family protein n=1 Tax=Grimontia sedimenti TaxID=2711294 RepID=A0A6M1RPR0_9GAMM|nr:polysaccharide pyruvyl transferase family protein [Grimontia sedimenti]NGO00122.1 polysaccharide pyruvyl transferase family protein [Grimontia sedimenti]
MRNKLETKNITYIWPNTQFENFGDLVINKLLIENLRSHSKIKVNSAEIPVEFFQSLKVDESEEVNKSNFCFLVDMIVESLILRKKVFFFTKPGDWSKQDSIKGYMSGLMQLVIYAILYACNVKICKFGGSFSGFGKKTEKIERLKGRYFYKHFLRDSNSISYAGRIGISNVERSTDLAFLLENSEPISDNLKRKVALSFRRDNNDELIEGIGKVIEHFGSDNVELVYQVERDLEFMNSIKSKFEINSEVKKVDNICKGYNDYKIVFSNRLHVLIFAMSRGCIPIALITESNVKISSLFRDIGISNNIINLSHLSKPNQVFMMGENYNCFNFGHLFLEQRNMVKNDLESIYE